MSQAESLTKSAPSASIAPTIVDTYSGAYKSSSSKWHTMSPEACWIARLRFSPIVWCVGW